MIQRFSSLLLMFLLLISATPALAAGSAAYSISNASVSPERGELFDLTIELQPNGENIDTARVVLDFDPSMLRAENVQLAGSLNRSAPGNYRDNTNGVVSWGAFTLDTPVSATSSFATVTFLALQEGETDVSVSTSSRAISEGVERVDVSALDVETLTINASSEAESGVALIVLESETHPDQDAWSTSTTAAFTWTVLAGDSALSALYYDFDQSSDTVPNTVLDSEVTLWTEGGLEDGTHYFHLKGVHADGRETPVEHYRVNIDTTAPNPIELVAQDAQVLEGEALWLTFATTDETSGVLQYQIAINESDFQIQQSPLEVTDLDPGTYFFRVAALDRAGNVAYEGQSIRVYPDETDLDRPEGYGENTEIDAVQSGVHSDTTVEIERPDTRVIIIVVTLLIAITLGYAINRKRNNKR